MTARRRYIVALAWAVGYGASELVIHLTHSVPWLGHVR